MTSLFFIVYVQLQKQKQKERKKLCQKTTQ